MIDRSIAPADQKRDALARLLAERAFAWPVVTLRQPHGAFPIGSQFYGVPSSTPGVAYLVNAVACQCPDYQRREVVCKHVRAVRLHQARVAWAAPSPAPARRSILDDLADDGSAALDQAIARNRAA